MPDGDGPSFSADRWDALIDSLSPYEIAVWTCASLPHARETEVPEGRILVVGKEACLWASAVAHIVLRNPSIGREQMLTYLRQAITLAAAREPDVILGHRLRRPGYHETMLLRTFLAQAGIEEDIDQIYARTEAAMRSLEWRGLIEDPLSKKFHKWALSILLVFPLHFNNPEPGTVTVDAITWSYAQRVSKEKEPHVQREVNFKIRELTEVVVKDVVPAFQDVLTRMTTPPRETVMTTEQIQRKLAKLGYYRGEMDGIAGPKTVNALRQFQQDRYLEVTGHPDPATVQQLMRS